MGLESQVPDIPNGRGNVFTILLAHSNHSPLDNQEYYFAWRLSLAPEIGPTFNNRAFNGDIKSVVKAVQISWRIANTPSLEIVPFYLTVWDVNGNLKSKTKISESPLFLVSVGATWGSVCSNLQDVHLNPHDQLMMSYVQTWVTNPTNLLVTAQLFCERTIG